MYIETPKSPHRLAFLLMRFKILLYSTENRGTIPVNYQHPLSAALYKIIAKGDAQYATFLHETGYGKGIKLFTFSQLNVPFKIEGDRLKLLGNEVDFQVTFHLPQTAENFIKGLFQSEQLGIADMKSRCRFTLKSITSLPNLLESFRDSEVITSTLQPLSPVVAGLRNEKDQYEFLSPEDPRFIESLIYNWRSKISSCYNDVIAAAAVLIAEVKPAKRPYKSRLITIKYGKPEETKIRGWLNLYIKVIAEKRFVELLLNSGIGVYSSQGMGCVQLANNWFD